MWPELLDYSPDECKRLLRCLELDAYSRVVSAFRAQGELSKEKKKILQDLQSTLSIPVERHKAEVRRAVNDERLATVADHNSSSVTTTEWRIEGRRLVPILPRLVPQTALAQTANQVAKEAAERNSHLLNPALTGNKELAEQSSTTASTAGIATVAAKPSRPTSPTSNVVVLPSGTSIHIKGVLNPDEEDEPADRRQRRRLSIESLSAATASTQTQTARVIYTTASSTPGTASPVKITISKSPQARAMVSQPGGQPQKVILVTSSSQSSAATMHPRSMTVPVIRASTSTSTSHSGATRTSIIIPGSPGIAHASSSVPGVVTVTTNSITTSSSGAVTLPTSVVGGSPVFSPSISIGKPRPKVVQRHRFPQPTKPGLVIPMGPGGSQPVAPSPHNIHVKTIAKPPPIHIKQDGGMKIITQSMPGASKILPKPAQLAGSPGTPVVVVNAGPSASAGSNTTVTMVPKTVGSYSTTSGSKVLNISAPAGRVIATTKAPNVVTVNPKTLQLATVKSAAGGTTVTKPNVIVVQKTQPRRPVPTQIGKTGTTVITNPSAFEKELANFIQKDPGRQVSVSISPSGAVTSATAMGGRSLEQHRVIITTTGNADSNRQGTVQKLVPTDAENRTSLLAELIQASSMVADSGSETSGLGGNEWFEFDDSGHTLSSDSLPASTVQSVMGVHNSGARIVQRSSISGDDHAVGSQEQYYSLEQAVSLLNADTPPAEEATILTNQPMQRVITSAGERIVTTHGGESGKAVVGVPRRLSASLMTGQGVVQTVRANFEGSDLSDMPSLQQSGELDPQTGLFYSSGGTTQQIVVRDGSILASPISSMHGSRQSFSVTDRRQVSSNPVPVQQTAEQQLVNRSVTRNVNVVSVPVSQPAAQAPTQHMDLLSSSLAQAQINLESYDFDDDDEEEEEEEEGLDPYAPIEAGDVVVAGRVEDLEEQQALAVTETVNFDAHTALLEESESGDAEILTPVPSVPTQIGFTNNSGLPTADIVSAPVQHPHHQISQQTKQTFGQSTASIPASHSLVHTSACFPLEDGKGNSSASINVVTGDQPEDQTAPQMTATATSYAVNNNNNSNNNGSTSSVVLPPTATVGNGSSKLLAASTVCTPSVSISRSSPITQTSPSVRLSPLPQDGPSASALSQNSAESVGHTTTSLLPQNSVAQTSVSSLVSVSNASVVRTTVIPKKVMVTASSLPQTVVIENSSSSALAGSDIAPGEAIGGSANSVSTAVVVTANAGVGGGGKSVAVLRDGHVPAVNSRTEDHKTESVSVLPVAEAASVSASSCSSLIDFTASLASSSIGDQEVDLMSLGESGSSDKSVDGLNFDTNSLRHSKRKRKPPSALEEAAGGSAGGSWIRAASNILSRVSRFKGSNREKGELYASAWFTQPVDVADAPDYYNIIKKPMDFSTIRKKLEGGVYTQFEEFHADMQLVRDNCFLYNSSNTRVYQDCTQVFKCYQQEIDRLLDKSATKVPAMSVQIGGSPPKKIIRLDSKSPGKT